MSVPASGFLYRMVDFRDQRSLSRLFPEGIVVIGLLPLAVNVRDQDDNRLLCRAYGFV